MTNRIESSPETVTDTLRRDILGGRFSPGERLLEIPLADRYECGRAAIRSALVELTAEGLVIREANRGAAVRQISIEEAIQITEARAALEGMVAGLAARRADEEDRQWLADLVADMRRAVVDDRPGDYSELNRALHRRLCEIADHAVALELINTLRNRAAHHQYRLAAMPGRPADSLEQHAAIVDAVIAGDEDAATEAMRAHLTSVIEVLGRWKDVTGL